MDRSDRDIDAFLESLPDVMRSDMKALDHAISKVMSDQPRSLYVGKFWGGSNQEIVGYGTTRYRRSDKQEVEWFVVGLALQKRYISVYLNVVEGRQYLAEKHGAGLGKVKVGKSSIGFASLQDINLEKFVALVQLARDVSDAEFGRA